MLHLEAVLIHLIPAGQAHRRRGGWGLGGAQPCGRRLQHCEPHLRNLPAGGWGGEACSGLGLMLGYLIPRGRYSSLAGHRIQSLHVGREGGQTMGAGEGRSAITDARTRGARQSPVGRWLALLWGIGPGGGDWQFGSVSAHVGFLRASNHELWL